MQTFIFISKFSQPLHFSCISIYDCLHFYVNQSVINSFNLFFSRSVIPKIEQKFIPKLHTRQQKFVYEKGNIKSIVKRRQTEMKSVYYAPALAGIFFIELRLIVHAIISETFYFWTYLPIAIVRFSHTHK